MTENMKFAPTTMSLNTTIHNDYHTIKKPTHDTTNISTIPRKWTLIAIAMITVSCLAFTVMCAIGQQAKLNVIQLLFGQYFIQLLLSTIIWNCKCIDFNQSGLTILTHNYKTSQWYGNKPYILNVWLRGFFLFMVELTLWIALRRAPIGDVTCIHYLNPVFIVLGGRIFFKESIPKVFIITFILPLVAMIFIVQPEFIFASEDNTEQLNLFGVLSAFLSAIAWAVAMLLGRKSDKNSHFLQVEFTNSVQALFLWIPILTIYDQYEYLLFDTNKFQLFMYDFQWEFISVLVMISVGVLLFIGVQFVVIAYQYAEASKIGYFEYLDLIFAYMAQVFVFKQHINLYSILGFLLMLVTCFAHLVEELYNYCKSKRI
eukprot:242093_1